MNIYIVVEGAVSEMKTYDSWITYINPAMRRIYSVEEFANDNFYLISGRGYPNYLEIVEDAIQDMDAYPVIDRLVVAVDSEDMTFEEKYKEIDEFIKDALRRNISYKIVIQHFCFETWALGNKRIIRRTPADSDLKDLLTHYNVRDLDPEGLTPPTDFALTRSQFAEKLLRKILQDRYRGLTYSKSKPDVVAAEYYFNEVRKRYTQDHHIQSFRTFIDAFTI